MTFILSGDFLADSPHQTSHTGSEGGVSAGPPPHPLLHLPAPARPPRPPPLRSLSRHHSHHLHF